VARGVLGPRRCYLSAQLHEGESEIVLAFALVAGDRAGAPDGVVSVIGCDDLGCSRRQKPFSPRTARPHLRVIRSDRRHTHMRPGRP